ncbi:MAG: hypothetical protein EOP05_05345 [Proteobacteria bacterium]|nr:MAG: hypothetical protein EOP05_05345 [Pseudomonadota bacterium]
MKRLLPTLLLLTLLVGASAQAEISSVGVMGFQAWKAARVEDAKADLEKLQADGAQAKPEVKAKAPQKVSRGDQKLQQAQLNLEIVQELTVNDYFVLYLNQFKDRSAFLEAARKLNSDEAADLMMAYQKHLTKDSEAESSMPSIGPVTGSAMNSTQAKSPRSRN